MRRGTLLAFLLGVLWVFPSCGGSDVPDGGGDATQDQKQGDAPTSNVLDSAAE